jgi:hypothetical protein
MNRAYLLTMIDKWLRASNASVTYAYIVFAPLIEPFWVISTVILVWGTYKLAWKEFEQRNSITRRRWWIGAKSGLFVIILLAAFYLLYNIATPSLYLTFAIPSAINDIAGRRNAFQTALLVFFFLFALLALALSTYTTFLSSKKVGGKTAWASSTLSISPIPKKLADDGQSTDQSTSMGRDVGSPCPVHH